jgi:methionyl-tRNA formyltransferase
MRMDEGMDTGPILVQAERPIRPGDTTGLLTGKLADLGARLLIKTLPAWLDGEIQARPQDDEQATYCRPLKKADGEIDWACSSVHLDRQVRATNPWPGAYTAWQGQRLKVLRARPHPAWQGLGQPGQVVELEPAQPGVVTGEGILELIEVQLAGKKPMAAGLFARGQRDLLGGLLGS